MKMLVSQKTRLIPNLRANGQRTHRHVRLPRGLCRNHKEPKADPIRWRARLGNDSSPRTTEAGTHSEAEFHPLPESLCPGAVGGNCRRYDISADIWAGSRKAFDSHWGLGGGWRHN